MIFSLFNLEGIPQEVKIGRGGLAQLGERLPCKQEASGSIPLISTTSFQVWIEVFIQSSEHFNLTLKKVRICTLKTEQ